MKRQRRRIGPKAELNVTPLIDILLVLLVIFMTISPTTRTGLNTVIPQPPPPDRVIPDADKVIVLSADQDGTIRINQEEVEPARLIARLQDIFKTRHERTIFVQAHEDLLFNDVARLIDAAKGAGVDQIGLMTEQISSK